MEKGGKIKSLETKKNKRRRKKETRDLTRKIYLIIKKLMNHSETRDIVLSTVGHFQWATSGGFDIYII